MDAFLVFGMPRSRTAWVANFLTTDRSLCLHEGLVDGKGNALSLHHRMARLDYPVVGNADTGMIHQRAELQRVFPDARLVVLTGATLSWSTFARAHCIEPALRERIESDYRDTRKALEGKALEVNVHHMLQDERCARALWAHCLGAERPFPHARWRMLRDLNVQVIPESLERRIF